MKWTKIKWVLAKHPRFNSHCFICKANFKRGFTFHHLWYNGPKKNYPKGGTQAYYDLVKKEIQTNPEQFLFLCKRDHQKITILSWYNRNNLEKLLKVVDMAK